jgi:hypothetical protein
VNDAAVQTAKDTLLRALEQLQKAEEDLEVPAQRVDLVVVYSIGADLGDGAWHEVGGWATTTGPKWLHAALLRRAAQAFDGNGPMAVDDDEDDDGRDS